MKISLHWLTDFVDLLETDPHAIAERLTIATGEVDEVEVQGAHLAHCVVGKVTNLRRHPNADKLSLCDVQTEQGTKKVVCGGSNLKDSMLVAFAHVGATVKWHGGDVMTLAPAKIRGEESEGMICAAEELGLETRFSSTSEDGPHPIIDLSRLAISDSSNQKPITNNQQLVGAPLRDALRLTDVILHIDNHAITNRPDLFSHIGVARELVALGLAKWKKPAARKRPAFPKKELPFGCKNEIPDLIPSYHATLIEYAGTGMTPDWMRERLEATGWRCISLPVDITNYVAMETGMPLHSFDADDIDGDIRMRTAKAGETIVTLDGIERKLNAGAIIMEDRKGIFDLLGIMGGLRGSTKSTTRRAYLHSAIVDGASIRRTVIAIGHRTDAATIYEKGIPLVTGEAGFIRALELFLELVPGARIASKEESWSKSSKHKPIKIGEERINGVIGQQIPSAAIKSILNDLGFSVTKAGKTLSVIAPGWRNDISQSADIIEEVARIHGYDRIPAVIPSATLIPPPRDQRANITRDALKEHGYTEMLHLAFSNAAQLKKFGLQSENAVSMENPIGEETSLMRVSLLPSLAQTAATQMKNADNMLKLYEIGHVFAPGSEKAQLCVLVAAKGKTTLLDEPLLIAKADLQSAFSAMGYTVDIEQQTAGLPPFAHPGRSAKILCKGKTIGLLCELSPQTLAAADLPGRAASAIIDWDTVMAMQPAVTIAKPLPLFPSVIYDETIPIDPAVPAKQLIDRLKKADPLLESVEIIDLYEKDEDKRMTLRFTYRAVDRTLQQTETGTAHAKVLGTLKTSA